MPTVWTDETAVTTVWTPLEPIGGFGQNPFGDPTSGEYKGRSVHFRGFGDPTTKWSDYAGD